jgi:hypothetical protein
LTVLGDDFSAARGIPWFVSWDHPPSLSETYCRRMRKGIQSKYQ